MMAAPGSAVPTMSGVRLLPGDAGKLPVMTGAGGGDVCKKDASIAASPELSVTAVLAAKSLAMDAVPDSTLHCWNVYPVMAVAEMAVTAPWSTVTGDIAGAVIVPPSPAVTESW